MTKFMFDVEQHVAYILTFLFCLSISLQLLFLVFHFTVILSLLLQL